MDAERVVAALRAHAWVGSARPVGDRTVAVRPTEAAVAVRPAPGPLLQEHLDHWADVYGFVYTAARDRHSADLDLSGWRASDTGEPLPPEHMREWIGHAVGLVLRGGPDTVLELGCGSGLLAHRLVPRVGTYVGTDVAGPALRRLRAEQPTARFALAAAHQLAGPDVQRALSGPDGTARPDRIVLNSVTQCFPNAEYLAAVVDDALHRLRPGGTLVVGDVRNLATLPAFAGWVESAREPGLDAAELAERAARRAAAEEELVCDPRLFRRLGDRFAERNRREVRVVLHAKPFRHDSELGRYRYDATLTVDPPPAPPADAVGWAALPAADRVAACARLLAGSPDACVTGIPHALLDPGHPDAAHPGELAAALPPGASLLLDAADGSRLAAGRPDRAPPAPEPPRGLAVANDPFRRFLARRLPALLADHLDTALPGAPVPRLVLDDAADTAPGAAVPERGTR